MKIHISILLAALCLSARAEVIVYKSSATLKTTGSGKEKTDKIGGFSLLDTATGDAVDINTHALTKKFEVYYLSDHTVSTVQGALSSYTIVALVSDTLTASGLDFAKGKNGVLTFNGKSFALPKAFTTESRGVYWQPDEFLEAKGKLAFDAKHTGAFDLAGKDIDAVVDALRAELVTLGYTEDFSRPAPTGTPLQPKATRYVDRRDAIATR